jgi:hypothetical protein
MFPLLTRRSFISSALAALLAGRSAMASSGREKWKAFVKAFNESPALREFCNLLNSVNEGAKRLSGYETGRVVAADDERAQLLDAMLADYAAAIRIMDSVKSELEAERGALQSLV